MICAAAESGGKRGSDYAEILRGSILTILPSRTTATLFPARRCRSIAVFTPAFTALFIVALSEKILVTLRLREVFLVMASPYLNECIPDIEGCNDAGVGRIPATYRHQRRRQS